MRPAFLILGASKCGTTSLYDYLVQHPDILPARQKEIHYFSSHYRRGMNWYRSFFPYLARNTNLQNRPDSASIPIPITGEATPYYLFHPLVPERVRRDLPNVRLIAMLRNPIDRAFSHYHDEVRMGFETAATFEEGLRRETERLAGEIERLQRDPHYEAFQYRRFSYVARGRYAEQLERWWHHFPREQMLILRSERFFENPAKVFADVLRFLGLSAWEPAAFTVRNPGNYRSEMHPATRERLASEFAGPNRRLIELLGEEFAW